MPSQHADEIDSSETRTVVELAPLTKLTLLDAGAAPREPIRYRYPRGAKTVFAYSVEIVDTYGSQRIEHPRFESRSEQLVVEATGDRMMQRSRILELGYRSKPGGEPPPIDDDKQRRLRDMKSDYWIDLRDHLLGGLVTVDRALEPQDHQTDLTTYSIEMPFEPVGIGARWRVELQRNDERVAITSTIVERTRDTVDITTEFEHVQRWPDGTYMHGTGSGRDHLDLVGHRSSATIELHETFERGGQTGRRDVHTVITPVH